MSPFIPLTGGGEGHLNYKYKGEVKYKNRGIVVGGVREYFETLSDNEVWNCLCKKTPQDKQRHVDIRRHLYTGLYYFAE